MNNPTTQPSFPWFLLLQKTFQTEFITFSLQLPFVVSFSQMILQTRFWQQLQPSTIGKTNRDFFPWDFPRLKIPTHLPLDPEARPEVRLMSCDLEARAICRFSKLAKVSTHRIDPKEFREGARKNGWTNICIYIVALFFWTQLFSRGSRFTFWLENLVLKFWFAWAMYNSRWMILLMFFFCTWWKLAMEWN